MTAERYTIVFTGLLADRKAGEYPYLTAGDGPDASRSGALHRGRPSRESLKREISFQDLPAGCRKVVLDEYATLWNL